MTDRSTSRRWPRVLGAAFLALRSHGAYVSVAASVPFWILAHEAPGLIDLAPAVLTAGPVWHFWRRFVTTRRPLAMRGGTPDSRLARGPLVDVPARKIAFPHTLAGAMELRDIIQRATGLRFEHVLSDVDPPAWSSPAASHNVLPSGIPPVRPPDPTATTSSDWRRR